VRFPAIGSALGLVLALVCVSCTPGERQGAEEESEEPVSRQAVFAGRQVNYVAAGRGEPALVLIHGWACDGRVWRKQLGPLADGRRLLVIDLPGHGRSEEPVAAYDMNLFADAIDAVMADAGVDSAVVVGHSNGVPAARQLYRRHPGRVAALVLVDGALRPVFDLRAGEEFLEMFEGDQFRKSVSQMISTMPAPELAPAERNEILAMALDQPQSAVVGGLAAALDPGIWEPDPIGVPTLMLLAEQPAWDDDYRAFAHELVPQLDYRVWGDGAGHFLMMERPEQFNDAVTEFAASIPGT
jgi:pimeloyl-ACP methyl ester carboxylesterase